MSNFVENLGAIIGDCGPDNHEAYIYINKNMHHKADTDLLRDVIKQGSARNEPKII
jgi:hypothetical protein